MVSAMPFGFLRLLGLNVYPLGYMALRVPVFPEGTWMLFVSVSFVPAGLRKCPWLTHSRFEACWMPLMDAILHITLSGAALLGL